MDYFKLDQEIFTCRIVVLGVLSLGKHVCQVAIDRKEIVITPILRVPSIIVFPDDDVVCLAIDDICDVDHMYAWWEGTHRIRTSDHRQ